MAVLLCGSCGVSCNTRAASMRVREGPHACEEWSRWHPHTHGLGCPAGDRSGRAKSSGTPKRFPHQDEAFLLTS